MRLPEVLDERYLDPYNAQLLGNLALVAEAVEARPLTFGRYQEQWAYENRLRSAHATQSSIGGITIDRRINFLLDFYSIEKRLLIDFATGGTVLDVGCGRSNFLDVFMERSETVAVDQHEEHVQYQVRRGHQGLQVAAEQLEGVETGSIRVLHATFSSPFWAVNLKESAATANEYRRVLEPGGVALVGPLSRREEHKHTELTARVHRDGDRPHLPWGEDDMDPYVAHMRTAFVRTLLDHGDQLQLIGERFVSDTHDIDWLRDDKDSHVPNFLIIRRPE